MTKDISMMKAKVLQFMDQEIGKSRRRRWT